MNKEILIFLHIGKSGGTTLHKILENQYKRNAFTIHGNYIEKSIEHFENLTQDKRDEFKCLKGHMIFGLHKYFSKPATYITILRDPVERLISLYYFLREKRGRPLYDQLILMDLKDFVTSELSHQLYNGQTRVISGINTNWGLNKEKINKLNIKDLEKAKSNLEKYFSVVGITEMFDQSLFLMKEKFGWKDIFYVKRNVTNKRPSINEIDDDIIEIIKENNRLDMELYSFALNKLIKIINNMDSTAQRKMKQFCSQNKKYKTAISNLSSYKNYFSSGLINYLIKNRQQKILVFGASEGGKEIYHFIQEYNDKFNSQIKITGFLDNDSNKCEGTLFNKKIYNPMYKIIKDADKIIIASAWKNEIIHQLLKLGLSYDDFIIAY